jgi:hypothetical protein
MAAPLCNNMLTHCSARLCWQQSMVLHCDFQRAPLHCCGQQALQCSQGDSGVHRQGKLPQAGQLSQRVQAVRVQGAKPVRNMHARKGIYSLGM